MQAIFQTIRKFADTDANLLLLGENGTGKDLIARYVYEQSPRKGEIYVPIDLGSIPETLFESELFGFEKGAFTDARKKKPGRLEVASGGTLFLNEIGNLSLPLQAKLLSVIEQRKSSRLGSTTSYPVDVRLICATNTDLYTAIDNGLFRQDLLYRINTIEIRIPPLHERGNDLFLLADHFLQRYRKKYKKEVRGISKEARRLMQLYRWPGNVRELEHAIERAVILSGNPMLMPDDFMLRTSPQGQVSEKEKYNLERQERETISEVLRLCAGNITLASEMLGITRTSLYRRIEKHGLEPQTVTRHETKMGEETPYIDSSPFDLLLHHRVVRHARFLYQPAGIRMPLAIHSLQNLSLHPPLHTCHGTVHLVCPLFRVPLLPRAKRRKPPFTAGRASERNEPSLGFLQTEPSEERKQTTIFSGSGQPHRYVRIGIYPFRTDRVDE